MLYHLNYRNYINNIIINERLYDCPHQWLPNEPMFWCMKGNKGFSYLIMRDLENNNVLIILAKNYLLASFIPSTVSSIKSDYSVEPFLFNYSVDSFFFKGETIPLLGVASVYEETELSFLWLSCGN